MYSRSHQVRVTHVGAMPGDVQNLQDAVFQMFVQVLPDWQGHQRIAAMLQNEAGSCATAQRLANVGEESGLGELPRHNRVCLAETACQLSRDRWICL